jgi:hypothetical protein
MGLGSFLKSAVKAPIGLAKGATKSVGLGLKGDVKGSLGAAKGSLAAGAGPALAAPKPMVPPKAMAAAPDLGGEVPELDKGLAAPRAMSAGRSFRGGRR